MITLKVTEQFCLSLPIHSSLNIKHFPYYSRMLLELNLFEILREIQLSALSILICISEQQPSYWSIVGKINISLELD